MARNNKALERLLAAQPPSDLTWDELVSILKRLGYELLKSSGGSGRKFYNREMNLAVSCHKPHPGNIVQKYVIRNIAEHLRENGLVEDKS